MKETSVQVLNYLKGLEAGANVTAADIAEALDMNVKSVNGILTASFQLHKEVDENGEKVVTPIIVREEAVIETAEGNKTVKFIRLTEFGKTFVPVQN